MPIDPDIRKASTLPGRVYGDPVWHAAARERIFARSWQLVADAGAAAKPGDVVPFTLLEGLLDEPLMLACDEAGELRCLSNVCTHRGNLVAAAPCRARLLRCRYHGRRFGLDGRFLSMPEFDGVEEFPAPSDDLARVPLESWGPLRFVSLDPPCDFAEWIAPVRARADWLPPEQLRFDAATSRDYTVRANWALYCDNYLEGFHVPYVHEALNAELDYDAYRTETFGWSSLQVGIAGRDDAILDLPAGHPDHGQRVAGYYFFLFPNLMLNLYPWGLSVNLVEPRGPDLTRVRFLSWVLDAGRRQTGAGADLHRVELEDEAIVEACQRGVRSRLYGRGRYSPRREAGVHHFHRLIVDRLEDVPAGG